MDVKIRQYIERDRDAITRFMEALQDHESGVDPIHRIVRKEGYGMVYMDCLLDMILKENGEIFVAEDEGALVGMVAGVIKQVEKQYVLGTNTNAPYGYIVDLFVLPEHRSHGIGAQLISSAEAYFRTKGCDVTTVSVLAHNTRAYDFYKKVGYFDRYTSFMKQL